MAIAAPGEAPQLLPLEDESPTLPSAIFFSFEDDTTRFGRAAVAEYVTGADGRLMRSLKSMLGTTLFDETTRVKRRSLPFSEILGIFIGELRRRAELGLDGSLANVVVGRPVQFVDGDPAADAEAQRQLEGAVRAQGFAHVEFQFEPIAAALDYEQQVTAEELALVIDIGGGTSDFSVIRLSPVRAAAAERHEDILATAGVHIGGTDFDRLLSMREVMPLLGYRTLTRDGKRPLPSGPYYDLATWHRINRLYNFGTLQDLRVTAREAEHPELVAQMIAVVADRLGHRLAAAVEDAKIALTADRAAEVTFASTGVDIRAGVSRDDLALALRDAVQRIVGTIDHALGLAGLGQGDIQTLILTGGSTQIPAIMTALRTLFADARVVSTDAFGSVGLGLALEAARRFR
ncbi:MAG TPA: Hsp70 family protein [Devosiaceae bacterium]|nr:Hsp70 family protein [Devosiaceae bacterium]